MTIGYATWRSAPTASSSSPGARTRRLGSGTRSPASRSAFPCSTRVRSWPWTSAPTASPSSPRAATSRCGCGIADLYQPVGLVLEQPGLCMAVAFSPDGKIILTGSNDGTARLWDAANGRPLSPTPAAFRGDLRPRRGVQPRRQDRTHREHRQDGAPVVRAVRPARRPTPGASRPGLRRGVQPRRQDHPHRER